MFNPNTFLKQLFFLFVLLFGFGVQGFAQRLSIPCTIHARVDTTDVEKRAVVALWIKYLSSQPDSIYDNPSWNTAEKKKYRDFDFTRKIIYQWPSEQLLNYYKPTILSVEKEGDYYAIKTLFYAYEVEEPYKGSNPWCITKLYAVKENNNWKLKNAFSILTQLWPRKTVGNITFIYSPEHRFNSDLANKANNFCDSIVAKFQLSRWTPFEVYVAKNPDEMGKLLGFDFYFAGYTTGMGMNDARIVWSGFDSEWYPHEFVHLLVDSKERHGLVDEGFATWLGGAMAKTFNENAKRLAQEWAKNDTITFDHILNKKWGWTFAAYYTTGAVICKLVHERGGNAALKTLLDTPSANDKLIQTVCQLLNIQSHELDHVLRTELSKYK